MDLHRTRKEKDKNTAMTMIFRSVGSIKDSALKNESNCIVSNANTRKLLYYKTFKPGEKKIELELQWFLEHDSVHIDTALLDSRIYLCSQSVLPLFADNFDFQTMEDFIRGVLMNEEFLDARIYWETVFCPTYALPISSWRAYQILCRDILQRQSYPLVPDSLSSSLRDFIYMSRNTYKHNTSSLSKGCILHSESIIGENSVLGENSCIKKSVIGPNCRIGNDVNIINSYVISDTMIEDDCYVKDSIIFSNCILEKHTSLDACLLLPNIRCSENYSNMSIEIENGKYLFKKIERCSNDEDSNFSSMLCNDHKDDGEYDNASSSSSYLSSDWSSQSLRDSPSPPPPVVQDEYEIFLTEVIDSLLRGYQDKLKCENLILEINSSRYAYNVNIRQVSYNVIKAILKLPSLHIPKVDSMDVTAKPVEYYRTLKAMLIFFKPIIVNYIKTENAQEDCLRAIQDTAYVNQELILPCVQNLIHFLYENDILLEDKIIEWYEQENNYREVQYYDSYDDHDSLKQEEKLSVVKALRSAVSPFVEWLREAEENSSNSS